MSLFLIVMVHDACNDRPAASTILFRNAVVGVMVPPYGKDVIVKFYLHFDF